MEARLHVGKKIMKRAKEANIGPTELGKMIGTTKQNVYGIYKRKSIDTELLRKISLALEFDFFALYRLPQNINRLPNKEEFIRLNNEINHLKIEFANKEIEYLKKINHLLMEENSNIEPKIG